MPKKAHRSGDLAIKEREKLERELVLDARMAIARRDLLKHMNHSQGVWPTAGVDPSGVTLQDSAFSMQQSRASEVFEVLTLLESEILEAMVSRIIPSDENGPGAVEARAMRFIDHALAGPLSSQRANYANGLLALNDYTIATRSKAFYLLTPPEQDEVMEAMEAGNLTGHPGATADFFNMVRLHTIEGTFSDPCYGGNFNQVGWHMLGYQEERTRPSVEDVSKTEALESSLQYVYDISQYPDPIRASVNAWPPEGFACGH